MPLPQPQENEYSYADYLTWPENERWEIIDGIAYMQAAPSPNHQRVSGELYRQFATYLLDKTCEVYPAPFCVRLTKGNEKRNEDVRKVVEPDVTVVCDKSKIDDKGCNGAPDLIVEVMSPTTAKMDKLIKFNKYETAGVKEYWIVDPNAKLVDVFVLQKNKRYGRPETYAEDNKIEVSIFPGFTIDLSIVFAKVV